MLSNNASTELAVPSKTNRGRSLAQSRLKRQRRCLACTYKRKSSHFSGITTSFCIRFIWEWPGVRKGASTLNRSQTIRRVQTNLSESDHAEALFVETAASKISRTCIHYSWHLHGRLSRLYNVDRVTKKGKPRCGHSQLRAMCLLQLRF